MMPRPNGKGKKIAFDILGVPANMQEPRLSKKDKRIDRRLTFEESYIGKMR